MPRGRADLDQLGFCVFYSSLLLGDAAAALQYPLLFGIAGQLAVASA